MKPRFSRSAVPFIGIVLCLAGFCQSASAAAYTWDLSVTAGTQTGDGTWSTADANWSTNGTTLTSWLQTNATTALHTATFGGVDGAANDYDVTLSTNLAAQTLTFNNTGYRLSAANEQTLSLNNSGTVITVAAGKSATIGNNATVAFNIPVNTGTRTFLGTGATLDIASGGVLTRTAANTAGPAATACTIGFTGIGTVNVAGTLSYNVAAPGNFGGVVISNGAVNDNVSLNVNSGGTVSSNSLNNGVTVVSGNSGTRTGTLTVNTGGTVSTTGTSSATSGINLANGTDSTGTVNLDGGTISTYQINSNYLVTTTNLPSTGGTSTFNFHGGTLKAIANNTAFMGGLTNAFVKSGGAVIDTNGFNVSIAQQLKTDAVSLGGGLTKQGGGTLTLTGANTYTGGSTVSAGTVTLTGGGSLGTGPIAVASGAVLDLNNTQTISVVVSGAGNIANIGGGTITFTGDSSGFTGTYTHNSPLVSSVFNTSTSTSAGAAYNIASAQGSAQGMIAAGSGDYTLQLGSLSGVANSLFRGGNVATGTTTLEVGALGTDTTFAGIIANGATKTIALTKTGTGSLTLSGPSTYTGATLVSEGSLNLTGSLGATAVTVASGATLAGAGSIASGGNLTLQSGSIVPVSAGGPGLSVGGDLTLEGTVQVPLTGSLAPTPGGVAIPFITYTGTLTGSAANLSISGLDNFRNPQLTTDTPGLVQLTTDSENLVWSGATSAWDINTSSNWNSGTEKFFDGDTVTFSDIGGIKNVILDSTVIPVEVTFNNSTGNDYTLTGAGAIAGSGSLTKLGSGTVTLSTANTYAGLTTADEGTLALASVATIPDSSGLVISNDATVSLQNYNPLGAPVTVPVTINSGGTMTMSGAYSVNLAALTLNGGELSSGGFFDVTYGSYYLNGDVAVGSGTSTISAARVTAPGVRVFDVAAGGTLNVTGDFSNLFGAFGLTKSGEGEMILNSANTYTGATTINAGSLTYGVSDAIATGSVMVNGANAVLDLGTDHSDTVGVVTLDNAGTITGSGTSALASTVSFEMKSGTVGIPLHGSVPLNKTTAETLTLTAANSTYSGGTNIGFNNTGTRIGVIRALASGALGTGTIAIGLGGNDATARLELDSGITLDNPVVLAARNTTSAGIQNLGGNNSLSGTLTITSGGANNLIQSDAGKLTFSGTTAVTNNTNIARVVTFQGAGDIEIAGIIENGGAGGSLSIAKAGAAILTLSGLNTYTGDTTVTDGTLVITNDDVLADTSTVTLPASGSLNLTHSGTDTVTGLVIGGVPQSNGTYTFGTGKLKVGLSTPFEDWAILKGLDGTAGKENGPAADPDKDGSTNLAEFAFNGNPLSGSDNGQIYVLTADSDVDSPDTAKELILTLAVRKTTPAFTAGAPATAPLTDGVNYSIHGSTDLASFGVTVTPVGFVDPGVALTDATNYEYRSFSLNGSNGLAGKGFLRAVCTAP